MKQRTCISIDYDVYYHMKKEKIDMTQLINQLLKSFFAIKPKKIDELMHKEQEIMKAIKKEESELFSIRQKIEHIKNVKKEAMSKTRKASGELEKLSERMI